MATLTMNLTSINNAISNTFVAKFLDSYGAEISTIPQNQSVTLNSIIASVLNPQTLIFSLPNGRYIFPYLRIRLYCGSILSNIFTDYVYTNFTIDCDSIVLGSSTSTSTTVNSSTTGNIGTTSTTVAGHKCQCNGIDTFSIVVNSTQNGVQFVSSTPITETHNGQVTSGTHRIAFASCGTTKLTWYVFVNGGGIVRTGTIIPLSNTFMIDLSGLDQGAYGFSLSSVYENGQGCTGNSIVTFTIAQTITTTTVIGPTTTVQSGSPGINAVFGSPKSYTVVEGVPMSTNKNYMILSTEMRSDGRYNVINLAPANVDSSYKDVYRINGMLVTNISSNTITGNISDQIGVPLATVTFVERAIVSTSNTDSSTWFDVRYIKPGTVISQGSVVRFRKI